jgi:hypothetical protein
MAKRNAPSLDHKKDLILHTYDSFLIAQTRLFVQACSNTESDSAEINRRRELLLLDDLTSFAIAARRLVELTGLKSFANRCMIPMVYLDRNERAVSGDESQRQNNWTSHADESLNSCVDHRTYPQHA